jgi:carbonic anhydrase/acetyltransferase-like protein (isoleucine patch superfamily)
VLGSPGKIVRELTDDDIARIRHGADSYVARAAAFRTQLQRIDA